jgi:4-diphosphocytidyl-2-C-methyl-D-erythritol kinase
VPFFLVGGAAIGLDRGDLVLPLPDIRRLAVVIVKPSFGVGTAEAYRWLDDDRSGSSEPAPAGKPLDLGWPTGPLALANDLERPVARRHPAIDEMVAACGREGALAASMSGSGSAVFAVFSEAAASRAARRLQRPDWLVLATRTLTRAEASRRIGL